MPRAMPTPQTLHKISDTLGLNKNGNLFQLSSKGVWNRIKNVDLYRFRKYRAEIEAYWRQNNLHDKVFPAKPHKIVRKTESDEEELTEEATPPPLEPKLQQKTNFQLYEPPETWQGPISKFPHRAKAASTKKLALNTEPVFHCECRLGCLAPPVPTTLREVGSEIREPDPPLEILDNVKYAKYTMRLRHLARCAKWREWLRAGAQLPAMPATFLSKEETLQELLAPAFAEQVVDLLDVNGAVTGSLIVVGKDLYLTMDKKPRGLCTGWRNATRGMGRVRSVLKLTPDLHGDVFDVSVRSLLNGLRGVQNLNDLLSLPAVCQALTDDGDARAQLRYSW